MLPCCVAPFCDIDSVVIVVVVEMVALNVTGCLEYNSGINEMKGLPKMWVDQSVRSRIVWEGYRMTQLNEHLQMLIR
jgi:hypothetical protein